MFDRMAQERLQYDEPVLHAAPRTREVHDHRLAGHAGQTTGQRRSRHSLGYSISTDGFGDARDLEL